MFWKKKTTEEEIFKFESLDKRGSFRVFPPADRPVRMIFKGKRFLVRDIGALGLSFACKEYKKGETDDLIIALPGEKATITTRLEILDIDGKGIAHCRFHQIAEKAHNAIHRYMLAVQKESVRKRREAKALSVGQDMKKISLAESVKGTADL